MRTLTRLALTGLAALLSLTTAATAQDKYPARAVKLIVPFAPGGQTDITARLISNHISQTIGQPLIIENRSGAGGSLGSELASKAAPDGYTLLLGTSSTHSTNPWIYPKIAYHPVDSFTAIAHVTVAPMALAVHQSQPFKTVGELAAFAKANPGKLNYGSSGVGSLNHIMGALFNKWAGVETIHVPYAGAGPEMADLMAGVIQMDWNAAAVLTGGAKTGQIRIIATTMQRRAYALPDIPTVAESGFPGNERVQLDRPVRPRRHAPGSGLGSGRRRHEGPGRSDHQHPPGRNRRRTGARHDARESRRLREVRI